MKLIIGLGNPGSEYKNTRHNVGFDMLDFLADKFNISFSSDKKFNAMSADLIINNEKVLLVKPLSYMNLSGTVVGKYARFYNIDSNDILVIQDDLDMELGKIRILFNSSSGGHNGIKNIEENIGTKEYFRLKIGISNNKNMDTKNYVLGKFDNDDKKILDTSYHLVSSILEDFTTMDLQQLKQKYNSMNNL